jgi:hypothetical protein
MFLAREIFELEKCKLDGRPSGFGIPYRFYVGIKTEFFDFIEQDRTFDSLGEDLGGGCRAPTVSGHSPGEPLPFVIRHLPLTLGHLLRPQ